MKSNIKFFGGNQKKKFRRKRETKIQGQIKNFRCKPKQNFQKEKTNILEENQTVLEGNLNINMERN